MKSVLVMFATSVLAVVSASNVFCEPAVKALWVVPSQFKVDNDTVTQPEFAQNGKAFLAAFRKRAPALLTPVILEGSQVTRQNVLDQIEQALDSLKQPGSIFIFYYGGHGIRPGGSPTDPSSRGSTYLAMQDCQVGEGKTTYNNMIMLEEIMSLQAKYERTYFMGYIDACFSGNESFNANQLLWSRQLGPRGFLLCSSGSNRLSYIPTFTKNLTSLYNSDDIFNKIHNPSDLLTQVRQGPGYEREQVPQLIPSSCNFQITYPLPSLCFCCIDFGCYVDTPINVTITPPNNRPLTLPFNEKVNGVPPAPIGSIAIPIQQLKDITIIVNFSSTLEKKFNVDLTGRDWQRLVVNNIVIPGAMRVSATANAAQLTPAQNSFRNLVDRAKNFGLQPDDITNLGTSVIAGSGALREKHHFISQQLNYLVSAAPSSKDAGALRLLAGLGSPTDTETGFRDLERALQIDVPVDKSSLVVAYADTLTRHIKLLKTNEQSTWLAADVVADKVKTVASASKHVAREVTREGASYESARHSSSTADVAKAVGSTRDIIAADTKSEDRVLNERDKRNSLRELDGASHSLETAGFSLRTGGGRP
jgi:Caspase domain